MLHFLDTWRYKPAPAVGGPDTAPELFRRARLLLCNLAEVRTGG